MKKLVPESIEEALQVKNVNELNEGKVEDWLNKAKGFIKGIFKKIGGLFVAFYKDKPLPAVVPVNIGILKLQGKLPKSVLFVADKEDIELEPSLAKLKSEIIINRVKKDYEEQKAYNKSKGGLKRLVEQAVAKTTDAKLQEEKVQLPYTEADKIRNVNSSFLVKRILLQYKNPKLIAPCIWGAPGIGKTAITKSIINAMGPGHHIIDVQTSKMMPDDWTLPAVKIYGEEGEIAKDIPKNWLPVYTPSEDQEENDKANDAANRGNGGIIFLDELSRASTEVQNTCLKLVLERIIGDKVLGSKWAIVAASNRLSDDPEGGQTAMGAALANRFQHFNFVPEVEEWLEWAKGAKIDQRITMFVEFNRDHLYLFDNESKLNTTPRSWEALSVLLSEAMAYGDINFSKSDVETLIAGTLHPDTTAQLAAFLVLIESFRPEEIKMVFNDPENAPKIKKKGEGYDTIQARALIGAACSQSKGEKLTAKQVENYVQYWIDLGNASLAALALRLLVDAHDYINKAIGEAGMPTTYKKAMDMFRKAFPGKIKGGKGMKGEAETDES